MCSSTRLRAGRDISDPARDLQAFETLWGAFAQTGVVEAPSREYAKRNFTELDEEEQGRLCALIQATPNFQTVFEAETEAALARVGIVPTATHRPLASKLVMLARMTGAWACRNGVEFTAVPETGGVIAPSAKAVPAIEQPILSDGSTVEHIPVEWRHLTPTQVAERMIAATPKMFEHRQEGKRTDRRADAAPNPLGNTTAGTRDTASLAADAR